MSKFQQVIPVPCQHIADYYHACWLHGPNLHNKLLWVGYTQWARGYIERGFNNLFKYHKRIEKERARV